MKQSIIGYVIVRNEYDSWGNSYAIPLSRFFLTKESAIAWGHKHKYNLSNSDSYPEYSVVKIDMYLEN